MKMKKIVSCVAAAAMAISLAAVSASAADWSQAGYADENPDTVNILSTDENGASFTATADGTTAKLRITLDQVLANPDDAANIKSMTWKVTYTGFTSDMDPGNGVGGGTYAATCNSTGYWISPDYDDDGNAYWGSDTYSVEDSVKYLLSSQVPTSDGELVFMDWSNYAHITDLTVTISDLKIFDEAGNEIAQKAYSGEAAPAAEEAPAEEAPAEEAPVEEVAPASDDVSTSASTGNASAAAIASVMAVAGVAATAAKKRK